MYNIVLLKRFCNFVDSMLTSDEEIVKVIITKAIAPAQSPIGMNIAILRNMYDIRVRNVNLCHVQLYINRLCTNHGAQ